jgi:hypothetical protein
MRFELFKKQNEFIEKHNKEFHEGKSTFTVGHNQFSDLTSEERAKIC